MYIEFFAQLAYLSFFHWANFGKPFLRTAKLRAAHPNSVQHTYKSVYALKKLKVLLCVVDVCVIIIIIIVTASYVRRTACALCVGMYVRCGESIEDRAPKRQRNINDKIHLAVSFPLCYYYYSVATLANINVILEQILHTHRHIQKCI